MNQDNFAPRKKNAKLKGGIAIALGAALLAGGGGTLAYWSTSETLAGASIETGDLNLKVGDTSWTLTSDGAVDTTGTDVASLAEIKIVPGDTLVLSQDLNVTLVGDNLKASLTMDTVGVTTAENITVTGELDGGTTTLDNLTAANVVDPIVATVTVVFDANTPDLEDITTVVNFDEIIFNLEQSSN